jgi:translation initiation factor 1
MLEEECVCPPLEPERRPPEKQTAKLAVEKRKRGKMVTVIRGLNSTDSDLPALLTRLNTVCGAGGTIDQDTREIQGKHVDRIRQELQSIGYKVRG